MADRVLTIVTAPKPDPVSRDGMRRVRELDRVELLHDVPGDDGVRVPAGSIGTVVAVWAGGSAYEVEFTDPVDALATVDAALMKVVEHASA